MWNLGREGLNVEWGGSINTQERTVQTRTVEKMTTHADGSITEEGVVESGIVEKDMAENKSINDQILGALPAFLIQ
jgi:hypothetical protein